MRKKVLILIALVLAFANSGAILAAPLVGATAPQIKFCHATNSVTNPYNLIETDANSIIQQGHGGHDGDWPHPVVSYLDEAQGYKDDHIDWGDIIPPFKYQTVKWGITFNHDFDGLNYTEEGRAMIQSNCQYVYTTPSEVTFTDATCTANYGTYTIPYKKGVSYYIGHDKKNPGTYNVTTNKSLTITAKADKHYTLDPTTVTTWTHNFVMKTKADCTVTPAAVTFVDMSCDSDGSYTIPSVAGVVYYIDDEVIAAGTYIVDEAQIVEIYAVAEKGYFLSDTTSNWTHEFTVPTEESCVLGITDITPAEVTFIQPTCSALGSYTIPTTEGIDYMIGEKVVAAGIYSADNGTTITVNAVPSEEANTIKEGAKAEWTNTFTAPTNCGSVLGETTVKTLPNTSGTGMNPIASIAAFSIAFMALAGAAMKRFYTERL
jgi:hypothetical protein